MSANFYVHIVESPSASELLNGETEGRALCSFLRIARIPFLYNLAVDKEQFGIAMKQRIVQGSRSLQAPPLLHLSAHGSEHGIQLTDQRNEGAYISWAQLSDYIRPIQQCFGPVGVCMSSCMGVHARRMAEIPWPEKVPIGWIVGTSTPIDLPDAALAFAVFYRRLQKGDTPDLIAAMRAASAVNDFSIEYGELTQQRYTGEILAAYDR